jgi:hypothetical protein
MGIHKHVKSLLGRLILSQYNGNTQTCKITSQPAIYSNTMGICLLPYICLCYGTRSILCSELARSPRVWYIIDSSPGRVRSKTTSPLSKQPERVRTKINWLGIRIMCPSGAIYLSEDCCVCELAI